MVVKVTDDLDRYYRLRLLLDQIGAQEVKLQEKRAEAEQELAELLKRLQGLASPQQPKWTDKDVGLIGVAKRFRGEFTIKELAEALQVSDAAVYQRLEHLTEVGILEKTEAHGKYRLTDVARNT